MISRFRLGIGLVRAIWIHPENRGRRIRAIARFFAWQVWERTIRSPWTVHLTSDRVIRCHPHSAGASNVIYCRLMEWRDMPFVLHYLRPGDVFIDIGANIGVYSLLASTIPDVTILAFEPASIAYQRLLENLNINGLTQVNAHNIAMGAADGTAFLTTDRDTTNRIVEPATNAEPTEPITVRSLDSFLRDHNVGKPSIIKVDVEGQEMGVLEGAWKSITAAKPVLIIEQNHPGELRSLLGRAGYEFYRYVPSSRTLEPTKEGEREQNVIAIFDHAAACLRVASPKSLLANKRTAD